jgi:6,7-dimethyl-8-ribityllumazine synthase
MSHEFHGSLAAPERCSIGIAVSSYNETITGKLLAGAKATLVERGVPAEQIDVAWVPGAFELPFGVQCLLNTNKYNAVLGLGCVIRGETTHDQHINRAVSMAMMELGLKHARPVAFGLLTVETFEQGMDRAGGAHGNKGSECAEAALRMLNLQTQIRAQAILEVPY